MRNWNATLYFGDMPGRSKPLDSWTTDLGEHGIDQIVCLIPEDEVAQESPEYADWIDRLESDRSGRYLWLGAKRVSFTQVAVHDYRVPEDADAHEFWEAAFSVALAASEGDRVFIHCGAGVGRTGMFAVAVLRILGYSPESALDEIADVGSRPETNEQLQFLSAGIPRPILETQPPADGTEYARRLANGPNDRNRNTWQEATRLRAAHPVLQRHGLRTIADPFSRAWLATGHDEKMASFDALARHTLGDISDIDRPDKLFLGYVQLGRPFATLLSGHTRMTPAGPTVAATLFLQAALDNTFALPVSTSEIDVLTERYQKLQTAAKVKALANSFAKKGLGRLPLGRHELDSPSAEAKKLSVSDKLANIRNILESGVPLLDAVLVYRAYYTREKREDVVRQLPEDLATLAGVAVLRSIAS